MIELFEQDLKDDGRRSSKGNQLKWSKDGIWYKADYLGYEGLSEYIISKLLRHSTLSPDEFTDYEPETIRYKSQIFNGCKSPDFSGNFQTITIERLIRTLYGVSIGREIYKFPDHTDRLRYLVDQTERATGLKDFGIYMSKLMTIDAVFLNEDRHSHNISVLWDGRDSFRLCPIYDNGAALLSDTTLDYPVGCDIYSEKNNVKSKTFSQSLEEQLEISEKLFGINLKFSWNAHEVKEYLNEVKIYDPKIVTRVIDLLLEQRRKYSYLFF